MTTDIYRHFMSQGLTVKFKIMVGILCKALRGTKSGLQEERKTSITSAAFTTYQNNLTMVSGLADT